MNRLAQRSAFILMAILLLNGTTQSQTDMVLEKALLVSVQDHKSPYLVSKEVTAEKADQGCQLLISNEEHMDWVFVTSYGLVGANGDTLQPVFEKIMPWSDGLFLAIFQTEDFDQWIFEIDSSH